MKLVYLVLPVFLITSACGNSHKQSGENGNTEEATAQMGKGSAGHNWEELTWRQFKDQQGNVIAEQPYPASWKMAQNIKPGEPSITGPHGVKVNDYAAKNFMYTNDYALQQSYMRGGIKLRPFPGYDQVIKQDVEPSGAQLGLKLISYREIPEISAVDKWYNDQLYKAMPTQTEAKVYGIDWKGEDGSPHFLLVHFLVSNSSGLQSWYYFASGLVADASYYERAKKQLIFSLANTHYPLEPIAAYNKTEMQRIGRNWAEFNARMARNQAQFEASQREHVNRTQAINDAIMKNYHDRDAASEKNTERFVDAMREETNVKDPATGQVYKVQSHYNHYWMNSNGDYISTDKHTYDPNLDDNMNNVKWQELNEIK